LKNGFEAVSQPFSKAIFGANPKVFCASTRIGFLLEIANAACVLVAFAPAKIATEKRKREAATNKKRHRETFCAKLKTGKHLDAALSYIRERVL
jgi:hypothetical protein